MKCKNCGNEVMLSRGAYINLELYKVGGSVLVASDCCSMGYVLKMNVSYDITEYTGDKLSDDWGRKLTKNSNDYKIDGKSLRIGNLVHAKLPENQQWREHPIDIYNLEYLEKGKGVKIDIKPMLISERLLERCNLVKMHWGYYWTFLDDKLHDKFKFYFKEGGDEWYIEWDGSIIKYFRYFHELQNLFYILTKKELIIKK